MEIGVLHEAAIDEKILMGTLLAGCLGFSDKTADAAHGSGHLYGKDILGESLAKDIGDALQKGTCTEIEQLGTIAVEGKSNIGTDEDNPLESREDIIELSGVGLQELTAYRNVVEKVLDLEVRADRTGHRILGKHLGGSDGQARAHLISIHSGCQFHL